VIQGSLLDLDLDLDVGPGVDRDVAAGVGAAGRGGAAEMAGADGAIGSGAGPALLRRLDGAVERELLDEGAWVDVRRSWVAGASGLFERLVDKVDWHAQRRRMYERVVDVPRLTAFFDDGEELPDPILAGALDLLGAYYRAEPGSALRTVGLCLYRDGQDSVAWHGDTIGLGATSDVVVAIVSLGATRRLSLRPRGGGAARRFDLGSGDLLVMGGSCQRTWEHAIAKTAKPVGARVSIQFRPAGVR
jgi:alkylated DNA repair dioxygenase AlkB